MPENIAWHKKKVGRMSLSIMKNTEEVTLFRYIHMKNIQTHIYYIILWSWRTKKKWEWMSFLQIMALFCCASKRYFFWLCFFCRSFLFLWFKSITHFVYPNAKFWNMKSIYGLWCYAVKITSKVDTFSIHRYRVLFSSLLLAFHSGYGK